MLVEASVILSIAFWAKLGWSCCQPNVPRMGTSRPTVWGHADWMMMVGRGGFEPPKAVPADLQSAPFGRSGTDPGAAKDSVSPMPTFDVVSEVDMQEVKNAVDQASREVATRFDFKNTDSSVELTGQEVHLHSATEDRLRAVVQVLEEKLVKRQVSLKSLDQGKVEEATKGTVRQTITIRAGIDADRAKQINKHVKDLGLKGVSSQTQGEQVRVQGKKRDDLQAVIQSLKGADFGIPLQFQNFRD